MNAKRTILIFVCMMWAICPPPNARADFTFGEPVNLKTVIPMLDPARPFPESPDCFSYDGIEMYFHSDRPGGYGGYDLWVSKRASADDEWSLVENLGPFVNTSKNDMTASISADGLTLCFGSDRGDSSNSDIHVTTRAARGAAWESVVNLGPKVNRPATVDNRPWISRDGLEIYFTSWRPGGYGGSDIYMTRRTTTNDPWGEAINLGPVVNSTSSEFAPHLSSDGLVLLFSEQWASVMSGTPPRPGGYGGCDMWMTRRASLSAPWEVPVNLGPGVNTSRHEVVPRLSPDGSTLYFTTNSNGVWDNWQAPIVPIVDFNGDGALDLVDLVILIDHWGTSHTLCDIGPFAWGDGTVDIEDLKVFMSHWEKENVAHPPK